jgi:23S rRNA (guanosine2251-2'-O)-methyltransferase
MQAIESGRQLDRIYLQNNLHGRPIEKLNGFNISDHEGIVAQIARVQYQDLQAIISFVVEEGKTPLFLMLDGITDIRNIGGIARTAFCCGVHALIIPDKGVGALNEDAVLTSAGALEKISVCRVNSLMKAVDELHLNGIKVFASEMTANKNVFDCDLREPCAIIMGNEEKGIYPALMKICDERFKIPMTGDFESLNVGVATGMILYEVMRQRTFI